MHRIAHMNLLDTHRQLYNHLIIYLLFFILMILMVFRNYFSLNSLIKHTINKLLQINLWKVSGDKY